MLSPVIKASALCRPDFGISSCVQSEQITALYSQDCQVFVLFKATSRGSFLWLLSFVSSSAFLICCSVRCTFTCLVHLTLCCPCLLQTCFLYPFHVFSFFPSSSGLTPIWFLKNKISWVILCGNKLLWLRA